MQTFFQRYFKIRPNEFLLTQSFFLYYACIGMFIVVGISIGDSLLLTKASPQTIASLYARMHVAIGLVSIVLTYFYDNLMGKLSRTALLAVTQLLLLLSILLFHSLLISDGLVISESIYFGLAIWIRGCGRILIMLFFSFAGDYFSAHDARRLYGYIAGGLPVGVVSAGILTRKLTTIMASENMLYVCMGFLALGIVFSLFIHKKGRPILQQEHFPKKHLMKAPLKTIAGQAYIQLAFLVVLTGLICFVIIDAQMKLSARNSYPSSTALTAFFGNYYFYVGMLELFFQFLFVEYFLRRYGIIRSLMILPCIHIIMSTLFYSTGYGVLSQHALLIIVTASFFQDVFSDSLVLPSRELLFLPLPSPVRLRSQAIMSGIIVPAGQGLGGLVIIALTQLDIPLTHYSALTISFAAVWIALLLLLQPRYRNMLSASLTNTQLNGESVEELAHTYRIESVFRRMLHHTEKRFTLFILKLLRYRSFHDFPSSIVMLAEDPRPEIAAKAIELLGSSGKLEYLTMLEKTLQSSSSLIRQATILAICRIKKDDILPDIRRWLASPDPITRYAAMIGCGQYGGQGGRHLLRPILKKLASAPQVGKRRLAASLLRDIGDPAYAPLLERLLDDSDPTVCRASVKACATVQSPILLSHLFRLYQSPAFREPIIEVLEQMPEEYVPTIVNAVHDLTLNETARNLLLGVLSSIGGHTAQRQLWEIFSGDNPLTVRVAAGNALWRRALREPLHELSELDFERHLAVLSMNIELLQQGCAEAGNTGSLLRQFLRDQLRLEIECLFQLLSFKYDVRHIEKVQYNFFSSGPRQQANALELLDDILPRRVAPRIGELLDVFLQENTLHGAGLSSGTFQALARKERWLKVVMRYCQNGSSPGALSRNDREGFRHIEKVAFLKNVPLFRHVPANYLFPLAEIAETVRVQSGEMLFSQGERGDALYLVRFGNIDIVVNEVIVNHMGPGECIGEMAILGNTKRTASCIAQNESELLKISEQHFRAIVKSQVSVAFAVLRILAQRLRRQTESMIAQHHAPRYHARSKSSQEPMPLSFLLPERDRAGGQLDSPQELHRLLKQIVMLKELDVFRNLQENDLVPVARMARGIMLGNGETLFYQGEHGHTIYFLCQGTMSVHTNGIELSRLRAGTCLGEMAILDGEPHSASCVAIEESELLSFSETDFEMIVKNHTSVALALLKTLAGKLRRQTRNTIRQQEKEGGVLTTFSDIF